MTRRRPAKRRSAPTTRIPFDDDHRKLFRLAGDDWTPPAEVKVRHGVRSWTLSADYLMADGGPVTLVTRLTKTKAGVVRDGEELRFRRFLKGKA